jgi:lipopolysaccharide cholinephosphotransferase
MPRADYERVQKIAAAELREQYTVVSNRIDPDYPNCFFRVNRKNTLIVNAVKEGGFGEGKSWGIGIDVFPYDNALNCRPLLFIQRFIYNAWTALFLYKTNKNTRSLKARVGRFIAAPFKVRSIQRFRETPIRIFQNRRTDYMVQWVGMGSYIKELYPASVIFPTNTVTFEGRQYKSPQDTDAFLSHFYGDYMKLPPEDKRAAHEYEKVVFDTVSDTEKADNNV